MVIRMTCVWKLRDTECIPLGGAYAEGRVSKGVWYPAGRVSRVYPTLPLPQTTIADDTHPTGMLSCYNVVND